MIKTRLIVLFLCSLTGVAWGQEKNFVDKSTYIISYDFRTGKYVSPLKRVKVHTPVVFEIRNINPFAYKVTLTPKDSILAASSFDKEILQIIARWDSQEAEGKLATSQSDLGKNMANQASSLIAGDFKDSNVNGEVIEAEKNQQAFNVVNEILELDKKIRNEERGRDSVSSLLNVKKKEIEKIDTTNFDETNALSLQKVDDLKKIIDSQDLKILAIKAKKDSLEQKMNESIKAYSQLAEDFYAKYDYFMVDSRHVFNMLRYAKAINTIANNPQLSYALFKQQYEVDLKTYAMDIFKSMPTIDNYRKSYSELTNSYFKIIHSPLLDEFMSPSGITKTQAFPQFLKMKSDQLADWLAKYPVENILQQAQWVLSVLQDSSRYNIRSIPIQPENDLFEFHANIKKRGEGISDAHYSERNFVYRQPTFGGTRVDFSLGLAASYYQNVATYELDTASRIVKSDEKGVTVPSLVGMVTMSLRKTGYIAYGASAGMGIGVDNGKIQLSNFYTGMTMLLGKRERIFISLGPSLRNVRQLRANTPVGTEVPNVSDLSSYMKDFYKVGFFASVTYSLTKDAKSMIRNMW